MEEQLLFNLILYLAGYLLLLPFGRLSVHLRHAMAFFAGVFLWVLSSTVLLVVAVPVTALNICLGCGLGLFLLLSIGTRVRPGGSFEWPPRKKELLFLGAYLVLFGTINVAISQFNFPFTPSADSSEIMGVGHAIAKTGQFPPPHLIDWRGYLQSRMVFLPILCAGAEFFGVDFHYTLFPLAAIYLLLALPQLFLCISGEMELSAKAKLGWGFLGSFLLLSDRGFWVHAFFVNNHLLLGFYFTLSVVAIVKYRERKDVFWLVLAAAALATTSLQRNEMAVFAFVPTAIVMSLGELDRKHYAVFLLTFLSIAFGWQFYRVAKLGAGVHIHGWGMAQVGLFCCYLLTYPVVHFELLRNKVARHTPAIFFLLGAALSLAILLLSPARFVASSLCLWDSLTMASVYGEHRYDWGITWIGLAAILLVNAVLVKDPILGLLARSIVLFFMLRVLIFSLPMFPGIVCNNSGSRILMHIIPLCGIYVAYALANAFSDSFERKVFRRRSSERN